MRVGLFLSLVFCFFTAVAQQKKSIASFSNNNLDTIHWRSDYKLKPEDFKGIPERNSRFGAVTRASTEYNSKYANDTLLIFTSYCVFNKNTSWINPRELDSNLIEHEQGHFDIAEVFRRKLNDQFCFLENCNYKKEKKYVDNYLDALLKNIIEERRKFDEAYDKDCAFPPNPINQRIWTRKIKSLLANTNIANR